MQLGGVVFVYDVVDQCQVVDVGIGIVIGQLCQGLFGVVCWYNVGVGCVLQDIVVQLVWIGQQNVELVQVGYVQY